MNLDLNDYPIAQRPGQPDYRVNLPRCYQSKSSSSNPQTSNNAQGSAEYGSIGVGGNNTNTVTNIDVTSSDSATVQKALDSVTTTANNALLANNAATVGALSAAGEATHGIATVSSEAISAVSAANASAQNFVNANTALAFDTIDKLVTGSTDALTYEASQNGTASAGSGAAGSVTYVGPSQGSPTATNDAATASTSTATYLTIAVAVLTGLYFIRKGSL